MRKGPWWLMPLVILGAWFAGWLGACERSPRHQHGAVEPRPTPAAPLLPGQELEQLVRDNLNAELAFSPTTATWLGMHGFDDRIDDVRLDAHAREVARLRTLGDRVRALDEKKLDPTQRIDRLLLLRYAETALFELTELRPLERNPVLYVDLAQAAVSELLDPNELRTAERVRALNARLWKIRPLVDEARRNLRGTANELAVRKAIELAQSMRSFLMQTLPKAVQLPDAKLSDELRAALGDAARALDDFSGWLQRDLLGRVRGEFALGRDRFAERLRLVEGLEVSPEALLTVGERELREARRRYDEAAKLVVGTRGGGDALKLLEEDHAKAEELLVQAQSLGDGMLAFVRDRNLLHVPEPRPKVAEMPAVAWGFVVLAQPGPLEARPKETLLYVDPVEKTWAERTKQEHLRALNRATLMVTLAHELVGHYAQAERNRRAPTTMQKLAMAPAFIEGWAHYAERMVVEQGFAGADPKVRLAVERSTLLRAARLVAVVKLHAFGAKLEQAIEVFTDEADLDDYPARREAERAASDPMVALDAIGRIELERLRDDYRAANPEATLGAVHDAMLAHGSPPITVLRQILLPESTRPPL
jgi:uncharacterized protein (DUF885 family)